MRGKVEHNASANLNVNMGLGTVPLNAKEWMAVEDFVSWLIAKYEILDVEHPRFIISKENLIEHYQQDTGK